MQIKDIVVKVEAPYPTLENVTEDAQTVAILKNLLAAKKGEMTAVGQYIYQSVVADKSSQEIGKLFEEISVVEMMHTDLLMHAISEFGGTPKFEDCFGNSFVGNYINYSVKLKEMLEANITAEKQTIENYSVAISKVKNDSLKRLFERIVEDEKLHVEAFKTVRDNVQFLSI